MTKRNVENFKTQKKSPEQAKELFENSLDSSMKVIIGLSMIAFATLYSARTQEVSSQETIDNFIVFLTGSVGLSYLIKGATKQILSILRDNNYENFNAELMKKFESASLLVPTFMLSGFVAMLNSFDKNEAYNVSIPIYLGLFFCFFTDYFLKYHNKNIPK